MKIIFAIYSVFMVMSWLLPAHFPPWQTAHQEFLAAIAVLVAFFSFIYGNSKAAAKKTDLFVIAVAVIPLAQYASGVIQYAGDMLQSLAYILLFGIALFVGRNSNKVQDFDVLKLVSLTFLAGGVFSVFIAAAQWLGWAKSVDVAWLTPLEGGARPYANIGQPNNLATILGFSVASLLYLFEKNMVNRLCAGIVAIIIIFGLALAQSRTTWVVAAVLPFSWYLLSRNVRLYTKTRHVLLWVLVYVGFVLVLPWLGEFGSAQVEPLLERARQTHRMEMYSQAVYFITHGPWYGFGWGQIESAHSALADKAPQPIFYHYSHNIILDLLLWNGPWLGSLLVLLMLLWFGRAFFRISTNAGFAAWIGFLFFITHSFFEYPHAYLYILLPAGFLLGVVERDGAKKEEGVVVSKPLLAMVFLLGMVFVVFLWQGYARIEADYRATLNNEKNVSADMGLVSSAFYSNFIKYMEFVNLPVGRNYSASLLNEIELFAARYPRRFVFIKTAYIFSINNNNDKSLYYLNRLKSIYGVDGLEEGLSVFHNESRANPELLAVLENFGLKRCSNPVADGCPPGAE